MNPRMHFYINEIITLAQYKNLHQRSDFLIQVLTPFTLNYEVVIKYLSKCLDLEYEYFLQNSLENCFQK